MDGPLVKWQIQRIALEPDNNIQNHKGLMHVVPR